MPFPQTRDALIAAGYKFSNHAKCRGCHEEIEWYETPTGKKMPMNLMMEGSSPAIAHWSTCPERDAFRK
jgi:hypothetical protein